MNTIIHAVSDVTDLMTSDLGYHTQVTMVTALSYSSQDCNFTIFGAIQLGLIIIIINL